MNLKRFQKQQLIHYMGIIVIVLLSVLIFIVCLTEIGLISPRKILLYVGTPDISKEYDGMPVENTEFYILDGNLIEGDVLTAISTKSYTDIGEYVNSMKFYIQDATGKDVTDRYNIKELYGKIKIKPIKLVIKTADNSKQYDGEPLVEKRWYNFTPYALMEGHTLDVQCVSSIDDIGEIENKAGYSVRDKDGKDVSYMYDVEWIYGRLEINRQELVLQTESYTKVFDGKPAPLCSNWEIYYGTLSKGDTIEVLSGSDEVRVGTYPNIVNVVIKDSGGKNVTYRYNINYTGNIIIQPRKITIKTGSVSRQYNGQIVKCNEWELMDGVMCDGHEFEFLGSERSEKGVSVNLVTSYSVIHHRGAYGTVDYTDCYQIVFKYGTITIT